MAFDSQLDVRNTFFVVGEEVEKRFAHLFCEVLDPNECGTIYRIY